MPLTRQATVNDDSVMVGIIESKPDPRGLQDLMPIFLTRLEDRLHSYLPSS